MPYKHLKSKIIEGIDNNIEQIEKSTFKFEKFWVEVDDEYFQITVEIEINYFEGDYCICVNNCHRYIENSIENLKREIDKKNKKYIKYKTNCDKCFLLIVIPGAKEGCPYSFKNLNKVCFTSDFNGIFLYSCDNKDVVVLNTSTFGLILKLIHFIFRIVNFDNYHTNFELFL